MAEGTPAGLRVREACGSPWSTRAFMRIGAWWRSLTRHLVVGYRPERHYMRGPGPKSLERNSRTAG